MATSRTKRKNDPYAGLAASYLIDPRPVEYWNVQLKLNQPSRSWVSCTRYTSKAKADRDLSTTRSWIRGSGSSKRVFRIVAHLN
jgi:hypothetical protein